MRKYTDKFGPSQFCQSEFGTLPEQGYILYKLRLTRRQGMNCLRKCRQLFASTTTYHPPTKINIDLEANINEIDVIEMRLIY